MSEQNQQSGTQQPQPNPQTGAQTPSLADAVKTAQQEELLEALGGRTFRTKVSGQEREITLDEAIKAYSKVAGADEQFRESAKGRKALELLDKVDRGDTEAAIELMTLRGAAPEDIAGFKAFLDSNVQAAKPSTAQPSRRSASQPADPTAPRKVSIEELPEDIQQLYREDLRRKNEEARQQKFREIQEIVDTDRSLGILKMKDDGGKAMSAVVRMTQREVWRRVALGEPFSEDLVADVMQEYTRPTATELGLLSGAPSGQDVYPSAGPAGDVAPTVEPHTPPKRVPPGQPGRTEYIRQRALWLQRHPEA